MFNLKKILFTTLLIALHITHANAGAHDKKEKPKFSGVAHIFLNQNGYSDPHTLPAGGPKDCERGAQVLSGSTNTITSATAFCYEDSVLKKVIECKEGIECTTEVVGGESKFLGTAHIFMNYNGFLLTHTMPAGSQEVCEIIAQSLLDNPTMRSSAVLCYNDRDGLVGNTKCINKGDKPIECVSENYGLEL